MTSFDNIEEIRGKVAAYLSEMNFDNSPAAEYFPARLPSVEGNPFAALDRRERALAEMWRDFLRHDERLQEARSKRERLGEFWYIRRDILDNYFGSVIAATKAKIDTIQAAVERCLEDKASCEWDGDDPMALVDWPSIEVFGTGWGWWQCKETNECYTLVSFRVVVTGPGIPAAVEHDRVRLEYSGAGDGFDHGCGAPKKVEKRGIEFVCDVEYKRDIDPGGIRISLRDAFTSVKVTSVPLVDLIEAPFPRTHPTL